MEPRRLYSEIHVRPEPRTHRSAVERATAAPTRPIILPFLVDYKYVFMGDLLTHIFEMFDAKNTLF